MNNKKKIILHIGIGKTGTSSIQKMLYDNIELLKDNSIFFTTKGMYQHAHHHIAVYGVNEIPKSAKNLIKDILEDFEASNCKTMILTSEQFIYCKPFYIETLATLLEQYLVEIIFFVRRQVEYVRSSFLQKIKEGNEYFGSIEKFYQMYYSGFDYMERIKPWEDNFEKENIIVKLYDKELTPDVCASFIDSLSWSFLENHYQNNIQENQSLLYDFVPLIKIIDEEDVSIETRHLIIETLLKLSNKFKEIKLSDSLDRLNEKIKIDFQESNTLFSDKYLSLEEKRKLLS